LNIERDPTYNLGTVLLRLLEEALNVVFSISMKEGTMNSNIRMGNDEFILYLRKNYPTCTTGNAELGRAIWTWIHHHDKTAQQLYNGKAMPCLWGHTIANVGETRLPLNATQFKFDRSILPKIYHMLDSLGAGEKPEVDKLAVDELEVAAVEQ
jgi:hypothetical protein